MQKYGILYHNDFNLFFVKGTTALMGERWPSKRPHANLRSQNACFSKRLFQVFTAASIMQAIVFCCLL